MARSKSKRLSTDAAREVEWARGVRSLWDSHVEWARGVRSLWDSHEFGEEQFKLASGDDNYVFAKLASLARVSSAESIKRLRRGFFYAVETTVLESPPVVVGPKKRALIQLRKSTKLALELSTIASNFDPEAQDAFIYVQCHRPDYGRVAVRPYNEIFTEFAEFCSEATAVIRAGTIDPPKKSQGRLRPHVWPGLIPNKLPLSTLARVKALDKKIATDPLSTDNIWS